MAVVGGAAGLTVTFTGGLRDRPLLRRTVQVLRALAVVVGLWVAAPMS
jgi:hypothetical protein